MNKMILYNLNIYIHAHQQAFFSFCPFYSLNLFNQIVEEKGASMPHVCSISGQWYAYLGGWGCKCSTPFDAVLQEQRKGGNYKLNYTYIQGLYLLSATGVLLACSEMVLLSSSEQQVEGVSCKHRHCRDGQTL